MKDTRYNPATIGELNEGQLVQGRNGYSIVKKCIHGNLYYAYRGIDMMEAEINENDKVVLVSDDDEHSLDCCN